jgi:hypothetical protein
MQVIDTTKLQTVLRNMREKLICSARDNEIDLSKGEITGHVIYDGNWGDKTIGGFGFCVHTCIDKYDLSAIGLSRSEYKSLKDLVRPIEQEYAGTIDDFVEEVLDFDWDDTVDFAHWYQENGGGGIFKFYLDDDKIEVNAELRFVESKADTMYAVKLDFDDDFWTDDQKAHFQSMNQLGLDYTIRAEFSGSGDSGGYDGSYVFEDSECTRCVPIDEYKPILDKIDGDLSSIGYAIMDISDVDWYNNEGGGGHIIIDLKNRKVCIDVWQNFDESRMVWSDKIVFQN